MAVTTPIITKQFAITQSNNSLSASLWNLTDATDYTLYDLTTAEVVGILKLTGPSGVIHNNTNFSSPDIDPDVSALYQENLPLQTGFLPIEGTYSHVYSIRVTKAIDGVSTGAGGNFVVSGDRTEDLDLVGTFVVTGSTGNDGTYTVASTSYDSGADETTVVVNETVASAVADGSLYYDLDGAEVEYDFFFCEPEIDIELDVQCDISYLQSSDITNYTISSKTGGYSGLAPDSISRVHKLRAPQGIVPAIPDVVGSTATISASPIYTETWTSLLTPTVNYTLPSGLLVQYTVNASKEIDVNCSNKLCGIRNCIENVYDQYTTALSENYQMAEKWRAQLIKLMGAYMLYSLGQSCGDNQMRTEALAQMQEVVEACGCDCCDDDNTSGPQQVLPLGPTSGSGSTTIVTSSNNGITVSATTVGTTVTYQVALDYATVAGNLEASDPEILAGVVTNKFVTPAGLAYKFANLGLGNLKIVETDASGELIGADKNTAYNKDFGVDPGEVAEIGSTLAPSSRVQTDVNGKLETSGAVDKVEVLFSDQTSNGNTAVSTEVDLTTYTLPADTLGTDGDYIEMDGWFDYIPTTGDDLFARMYFGSYLVFAGGRLATGSFNMIRLKIKIIRTSATTQKLIAESYYHPLFGTLDHFSTVITAGANDLTTNLTLKTTGQTSNSLANQIVCQSMTVTIYRQ